MTTFDMILSTCSTDDGTRLYFVTCNAYGTENFLDGCGNSSKRLETEIEAIDNWNNQALSAFARGYQQAFKDINTPKKPIIKDWQASRCPHCKEEFDEECYDGYYERAITIERCPHCGQNLEWFTSVGL